MTVGPWRPILVHAYHSTIDDLRGTVDVKDDLGVHIGVSFRVNGNTSGLKASSSLLSKDGKVLLESVTLLNASEGSASFDAKPGELELWYPVGYGRQYLHTLQVKITDEVSSCTRLSITTCFAEQP